MIWKALVLTFRRIQTGPGTYRTLTPDQIRVAQEALQHFAVGNPSKSPPQTAVAGSYTDGNLGFNLTFSEIDTLVPRTPYSDTWVPEPSEIESVLAGVPWGTYDIVFVIAPYKGSAETGKFAPVGTYQPWATRGAAYAALPAEMDLEYCNTDYIVHEFLHGAATFFKLMGYPMPDQEGSDSWDGLHTGDRLYPLSPTQPCFSPFYKDLMRGTARPNTSAPAAYDPATWNRGIPLAAWNLGSPRDLGALAGRGADGASAAQFQAAYRELHFAFPVRREGRPDAQAYAVAGGLRQNLCSPTGDCGILKANGGSAFAVRPKVWDAFHLGGGLAVLGFPINALHDWSGVMVQDFRTGQTSAAVMQGPGREPYALKPTVWQAYLAGGGAPALGAPVNEFHPWGEGSLQDFAGPSGTSAVMEGNGRGAFAVRPSVWAVYANQGGAPSFGYPLNELHRWGAGNTQDFRLSSGWHTAAMTADGRSDVFLVKGLIWRHYVALGGATSYLGYPTTTEYQVESGGVRYYMQTFQGGKIRINQSTGAAQDYR